jgi:hypothetical protein
LHYRQRIIFSSTVKMHGDHHRDTDLTTESCCLGAIFSALTTAFLAYKIKRIDHRHLDDIASFPSIPNAGRSSSSNKHHKALTAERQHGQTHLPSMGQASRFDVRDV